MTFADAHASDTTVSFSEAGRYTLRLTATDTEKTSYNDVIVTVLEPATLTEPTTSAELARVLELVNEARRAGFDCGAAGRFGPAPALTPDVRLDRAAQGHAQSMAEYGYFSHTGRDGSTFATRVTREGYPWSRVDENITWGQPDPTRW